MFPFFILNEMKKLFIIYILLLFILMSCSGIDSLYKIDMPLSNKIIQSQTGSFSVNIPNGWRKIEANGNAFADVWMVDDSDEYSILFTPVNTDLTSSDIRRNRIEKLESIIQIYAESLFSDKILKKTVEEFQVSSIEFKAFEYHTTLARERFVFFRLADAYYISRAISKSKRPNYEKLFSIQNSVLSSLKAIKK